MTVLNGYPTREVGINTSFFISAVSRDTVLYARSTMEPYTQWLGRMKATLQRTPSGRGLGES